MCQNETADEVVDGMFRDIVSYAPRLAQFYLKAGEQRCDKLMFFENYGYEKKIPDSKLFLIAIGGDEAPSTGTTFLISFLNVGKRIASSSENFLIFGGDAK